MLIPRTLASAIFLSLFVPILARADNAGAKKTLGDAGLVKIGSYWVLPGEKELSEGLKTLKSLERKLSAATKLRSDYDTHISKSRAALQGAIAERRRLSVLLVQADRRKDAARIVQRMNQLADQIDAGVQYVNDPGPSAEIDRRIGEAADAVFAAIAALRENANATTKRYEELASDASVSAAIDALSTSTGRKFKLGPRRVFQKYLDDLAQAESTVQSDDIKLEKRSGVFMVEGVLNGKTRAEFVFDTGASLVSLSADLARRAGLSPSDDDPAITMQVADGRTVEGRLMFLDELRVGAFTAKNVECAVLPPSMGDVEPLLGGSFLRNFSIKLNHAAGTLTLTKIAPPEKAKRR